MRKNQKPIFFAIFLFVQMLLLAEEAPIAGGGWHWDTGATLKGKRFYDVASSYSEQDGYAIVGNEKVHYWLYDSITYHDGDTADIYNKYVPNWIERMGYVIDYDNVKIYNPRTNLANSVKALMQQRGADVSITFVNHGYGNRFVVINEYLNSKKVYKTTFYKIYTEEDLPAYNPMLLVKGGTFEMGDPTGNLKPAPLHKVTVSDFYMSQKEITFQEWVYTTGFYPNGYYSYYGEKPVPKEQWRYKSAIFIHWYEALTYCNQRSEEEGLTPCYASNGSTDIITNCRTDTEFQNITCDWNANGYRLPTEAEWEYAAKNDSRLSDMPYKHYEWCWDWYDSNYYEKSDGAVNPHGPEQGELLATSALHFFDRDYHSGMFAQRVIRGGGDVIQRENRYPTELDYNMLGWDIENLPFSFHVVRNAK